jgi:endonuclease YncB( thermonuclease family)
MFRVTFFFILLIMCFSVSAALGQRALLPSAVERRQQREQYNRRMDDPSNNPYKKGEEASNRTLPGQIPKDKILRLEPPKRAFLETEISEVLDGDTVAIKNTQNQRIVIRLLGIDAPELGQDFGDQARKNLEEKLAGKKVRLAFEPHGMPDEKGRILAKILIDDIDVCSEQVREGFAWFYEEHKERLGILEIGQLKELQTDAKKEKLQLWQNKLL